MKALIETSIETKDGIADCRMELQMTGETAYYNVTILYPNVVNGYSRSEIYNHGMYRGRNSSYHFDLNDENIHPKIKKLENLLSQIIINS